MLVLLLLVKIKKQQICLIDTYQKLLSSTSGYQVSTSQTDSKDLTIIVQADYHNDFTLPELHNVYNSILGIEIDRRNFRKKMLSLGLIIDTNKTARFEGNKPAKLYKFKNKIENKNVF